MEPWRLYYDGGCNLCHASKLRVEAWAERAHQPLVPEVLQSDEAIAKGYADAMVLEADGQTYMAEAAWLRLMRIAPWYLRWVGWLGQIPLIRPLLAMGYRVVARYRIKWFGSRSCPLPGQRSS